MSEVINTVDEKPTAASGSTTTVQSNSSNSYSLKSEEVASMLQHATNDIHTGGKEAAERAIKVVDGLAQAIKENTMSIKESDAVEMVGKVEEHIKDSYSKTSEATTEYRAQFMESTSNLALQVIGNAAWVGDKCNDRVVKRRQQLKEITAMAAEKLQENAERTTENVTNTVKSTQHSVKNKIGEGAIGVSSTIATVDDYMRHWLTDMAEKHPNTATSVQKCVAIPGNLTTAEGRQSVLNDAHSTINTNVVEPVSNTTSSIYTSATAAVSSVFSSAYNTAAPVVEGAMDSARPYVDQAKDASQPYVDSVSEFSKPYVQKAADIVQPYTDR